MRTTTLAAPERRRAPALGSTPAGEAPINPCLSPVTAIEAEVSS